MKGPKCFKCGTNHFSGESCPGSGREKQPDGKSAVSKKVQRSGKPSSSPVDVVTDRLYEVSGEQSWSPPVGWKGCKSCGATTETFEDAARWASIREKQRIRMRKKRSGDG